MIGKSDKIFTVSQDSKDKIKHLTNKKSFNTTSY